MNSLLSRMGGFYLMAVVAALCALAAVPSAAQSGDKTAQSKVEKVTVHGKGLEGNLSNDSPDREVSVYLPPSYQSDSKRRFPVVYMLHGYTDDNVKWFELKTHWINLPTVLDKTLAGKESREVIVVMPNAYTRFQGSMYSNSVTTGDWEDFVATELVAYIDAHYRTIPNVASRGLTGHSMGGYGAMRIGMKHPDVFSSVYLLSPCCMMPRMTDPLDSGRIARIESVTTTEEFEKADFLTKVIFASSAAWAPNPTKPPFFLDLPFHQGELQRQVLAKYAANAPLAMIDQYIQNLKRLRAIGFDAGDKDESIAATIKDLDVILNDYQIDHSFEVYPGDHVNHVAERIEMKAMPFFSKNLAFE